MEDVGSELQEIVYNFRKYFNTIPLILFKIENGLSIMNFTSQSILVEDEEISSYTEIFNFKVSKNADFGIKKLNDKDIDYILDLSKFIMKILYYQFCFNLFYVSKNDNLYILDDTMWINQIKNIIPSFYNKMIKAHELKFTKYAQELHNLNIFPPSNLLQFKLKYLQDNDYIFFDIATPSVSTFHKFYINYMDLTYKRLQIFNNEKAVKSQYDDNITLMIYGLFLSFVLPSSYNFIVVNLNYKEMVKDFVSPIDKNNNTLIENLNSNLDLVLNRLLTPDFFIDLNKMPNTYLPILKINTKYAGYLRKLFQV